MNSTNDAQTHQRVAQKGKVEHAFAQGLGQATDAGINQWGTIFMELNATDDISF
jgi:hypothetical protein